MLNSELEPLLGELSSCGDYPADIIEKFSAINHLLTVDLKTYFFDILIYLDCSTVRDLKYLVTNDNKFYQNVAKRQDILELVRHAAKLAVMSYNKRDRSNFLYTFYPVPVVPVTDIIKDFPVAYIREK